MSLGDKAIGMHAYACRLGKIVSKLFPIACKYKPIRNNIDEKVAALYLEIISRVNIRHAILPARAVLIFLDALQ